MRFVCQLALLLLIPILLTAQVKRDMLIHAATAAQLSTHFDPATVNALYPAYENRKAWDSIAPAYRHQLISQGEEALDYKWQVVPASVYLEFVRTGERYVMEDLFNQNLNAIKKLAFAELAEGRKRFIPQLINGVWAMCEITSWSISASIGLQKKGAGLPDVEEPIVELGAGITANAMAWTYHFFKKAFAEVNPLIASRLKLEITRRFLTPYYTRNDFWWMALDGRPRMVNNWNVWLNYNALTCLLLVEDDRQKQLDGIYKSMRSVDQFINYYKNDGACEEGPAYWSHAGGMLYNYLALLKQATGGFVNLFDSTLIRNIGSYICKAYIDSNYYLNYADASARLRGDVGLIYQFGKALQDKSMTSFGAYLARQQHLADSLPADTYYGMLRHLFSAGEILAATAQPPYLRDAWMPETGIAVARDEAGTAKGFYFSALAGHNDESHNHNDVGTCVLFYNGQPILIDVGNETYNRQTFSAERYSIWTMRSAYHNVPLINGVEQKEGKRFAATAVQFHSSATQASFTADIAAAYPEAAAVKKWKRSYELKRKKSFLISDQYSLITNNGKTELHFMTSAQVQVVKDGLLRFTIGEVSLDMTYSPKLFQVKLEPVEVNDKKLLQSWPPVITRLVLQLTNTQTEGNTELLFRPSKQPY